MRKFWVLFCLLPLAGISQKKKASLQYGTVKIIFTNLINNRPLVLHESVYTNPFGENYTVSKLKYYISNVSLRQKDKKQITNNKTQITKDKKQSAGYYLINQADTSSLSIILKVPVNNYDSIDFLPGVDSTRNCSGAQTGALDPLNDMFWTWNSGYVMEKIEGHSPQSNIVNNKIEYHIGGYKGENSVLQFIRLAFPENKSLVVKKGKTSIIKIDAAIDKLWQGNIDLKIAETPACSSPGQLAKKIAGNFAQIFSIRNIVNPE